MFWGLIMEPQRRYTQKVKKAFHVSMAAIDISTSSDEPAQVMCGFEGRNYLLCTLKKPDVMQVALDLNFDVGSELSFAANGKCHVHLTGYLIDSYPELPDDEEIEEEDDEQEEQVKKKSKKRNTKAVENGPPSKKSKATSSVNEEEEENSDDSDLDVQSLLGKTLDEEDDDDHTFIEEEEDDEDAEEEEEDDDDESELEEEEEVEDEPVSSMSEADSEEEYSTRKNDNVAKSNGVPNKKQKLSTPMQNKENKELKPTKGSKEKQSPKDIKKGKAPEKNNQSPSQKKVLQGGVTVEDLKEGQGPNAKNGKFVTVYYEGRLKQNNKIFDSTNKGNGFSFRLGNGEVIKGWDVGVAGMKVGGKRKIICPPEMAYGAKGSPPTIPGNSTLIFEVEMRKIR